MALERTLSIIKPDGVRNNHIGAIVARFEKEGLRVIACRMARLAPHEADGFYAVHKERSFFAELVQSMCSGPVLLMVLEGENAILKNREIMGATDPTKAAENTLRKLYSPSMTENTVHGSDAPDTAAFEIAWFFPQSRVFPTK